MTRVNAYWGAIFWQIYGVAQDLNGSHILETYNVCVVGNPRLGSTVMTSTMVCPALPENRAESDERGGRSIEASIGRSRIDCGDGL